MHRRRSDTCEELRISQPGALIREMSEAALACSDVGALQAEEVEKCRGRFHSVMVVNAMAMN